MLGDAFFPRIRILIIYILNNFRDAGIQILLSFLTFCRYDVSLMTVYAAEIQFESPSGWDLDFDILSDV